MCAVPGSSSLAAQEWSLYDLLPWHSETWGRGGVGGGNTTKRQQQQQQHEEEEEEVEEEVEDTQTQTGLDLFVSW